MKVGDRITSPWGDYMVAAIAPVVVLVSGTSAIVGPSEDFLARAVVESGRLPVALDSQNEKGTGPRPHASADGGSSPSESRAEIVVAVHAADDALSGGGMGEQVTPAVVREQQCPSAMDCGEDRGDSANPRHDQSAARGLAGANPALHPDDDHAHQFTLGAYRSAMSMAWCPSSQNELVWTPCAGRSQVPGWELQTHVYFLGCVGESIYCEECRAKKPRRLYVRDGNIVLYDSHYGFAPSLPVGFVWDGATGATDFPSASELLLEAAPALCASSADEEFASSALSPATARPAVWPTTERSSEPGGNSSTPALSAMTVAREEGVPPAPSDAKEVAPPAVSPSTFPPDDPKESVGSFDRVRAPGAQPPYTRPVGGSTPSAPTTPIGRPWLGLWEWKEWCAERAAIIEYDAGWPRKNAESRARDLAGSAPR